MVDFLVLTFEKCHFTTREEACGDAENIPADRRPGKWKKKTEFSIHDPPRRRQPHPQCSIEGIIDPAIRTGALQMKLTKALLDKTLRQNSQRYTGGQGRETSEEVGVV